MAVTRVNWCPEPLTGASEAGWWEGAGPPHTRLPFLGPFFGHVSCFLGASGPGLRLTGAKASIRGPLFTSRSPPGLLGAPPAVPLLSGPALSTALLQLALKTQGQKVSASPARGPRDLLVRTDSPALRFSTSRPSRICRGACRRRGDGTSGRVCGAQYVAWSVAGARDSGRDSV